VYDENNINRSHAADRSGSGSGTNTNDAYDKPIPRLATEEIHRYLVCRDFTRAFVHLGCTSYASYVLVPLSRKSRALCQSCAGRRMLVQAAPLVDAVVPTVPLRHYVLSFAYDCRWWLRPTRRSFVHLPETTAS